MNNAAKSANLADLCPRIFTTRRSIQIAAGSLLCIAALALIFAFYAASPVVLPLVCAFVISIILAPLSSWLMRRGLNEGLAAGAVTLAAVGLILFLAVFAGKPAAQWLMQLPELAEEVRRKLNGVEEAINSVKEVSERMKDVAQISPEAEQGKEVVVASTESAPSALAETARTAIVQFLLIWVFVFFFLASRTDLKRKLVAAHQGFGAKVRALHMFRDIEGRVGSYMFTMVIINAGLGAAMGVAALLLEMPSPHIWGVLAAVLNFVPYLGPAALTILLGMSGIVHYEDPLMALAPMAAYVALNFIESNIVTPLLVGVRLRVTPLAIIISISLLTWLWGAIGAVIAIPLLVIFKTICDSTPILRPIGVLIGELEPQQPFQTLRRPLSGAASAR